MHEDLIKRLRNCISDTVEDCAGCPYQGGYNGTYCMNGLISDAADAIEAQDRHILTIQHEMMAEAESHIAEVNRLNKQIEELQADVRPVVRGKWVLEYEPNGKPYCFHCSVCDGDFHYIGITTKYDFCPKCGAYMREKNGEEI